MARFERLAARNPGARESHLALAEAAVAAQLGARPAVIYGR